MYYSKYTVNWNALSHSEINKTELFKPKWLVPYPILKLENKYDIKYSKISLKRQL